MSSGLALEAEGGRWKRYPAYKDSGVEWLGAVPEGWSSPSVKHQYTIQLGKMLQNKPDSDEDILVPYAKALYVLWGTVVTDNLPKMWANPSDIQQYGIEGGDLLVCEGGEVGRAGVVTSPPEQCIIQNALHRVRAKKSSDVYFLQYILHAVSSSTWFDVLCNKATIAHFTREKFADLRIPVPPLPEQRAIAAFLDRETGRIDALIEKKERQIELLQEKRAALISHAVTKGLDPDVPMKDSGVEWLGEVPAHWAKMRIKHLLHQIIDTEHKTAPYSPDGNYLVVRTANVRNGILSFDDAKYTDSEGFKEWTRRGVPKPCDILFTREAPAGEACIVPDNVPLCIGQRMVLFRVNKQRLDARFGIYSIYGGLADEFIRSLSQGSTVGHFNMSDIGNTPLFEPSLSEQHTIAAFLDHETGHIDTLTTKVYESISKLREYRTALISAAVTGKIDVREELVS